MKTKITLPLSEASTGIRDAVTEKVTKNGIIERCRIISFEPLIDQNVIMMKYHKQYFDSKDNLLEFTPKIKTVVIIDKGEIGEAEIDNETGLPIMETYTKIKDEDLAVTGWDAQLGEVIIGSLVEYVKNIEGYI